LWIKYISFFYYSFNVLMINQWADIEDISCAPDGSATAEGGGSLGYYAVWLALTAGNSNSTDISSQGVPCISSGQQVLEQFNIRPVSTYFHFFACFRFTVSILCFIIFNN
jgi:hypothetical protein